MRRHEAGEVLRRREEVREAIDQLGAVEQQAVVEAPCAEAADEAIEVVHRPLAVRRGIDCAREVHRELLDLLPDARQRQQLRDGAQEQVEQRLDALLGEQRRERGADLDAMALELFLERRGWIVAGEAEGARQRASRGCVERQAMVLPLADHLEAVLGAAQERVGAAEGIDDGVGEHADLRQRRQRPLGRALADVADAAAVLELQGLGDELDVADPAAPTLTLKAPPDRSASCSTRSFIVRMAATPA